MLWLLPTPPEWLSTLMKCTDWKLKAHLLFMPEAKKTHDKIGTHYIFNRINPKACPNCVENPVVSFTFSLAEEPEITYAIGFLGKKELPAGQLIKRV